MHAILLSKSKLVCIISIYYHLKNVQPNELGTYTSPSRRISNTKNIIESRYTLNLVKNIMQIVYRKYDHLIEGSFFMYTTFCAKFHAN